MKYPKTGSEVYVSLNLSNTMLTGIGKSSAACWRSSTSAMTWSWRSLRR